MTNLLVTDWSLPTGVCAVTSVTTKAFEKTQICLQKNPENSRLFCVTNIEKYKDFCEEKTAVGKKPICGLFSPLLSVKIGNDLSFLYFLFLCCLDIFYHFSVLG